MYVSGDRALYILLGKKTLTEHLQPVFLFFFFKDFYFMCMKILPTCIYVYVPHACSAKKVRIGRQILLELELQQL